jgi:hypothetical protein
MSIFLPGKLRRVVGGKFPDEIHMKAGCLPIQVLSYIMHAHAHTHTLFTITLTPVPCIQILRDTTYSSLGRKTLDWGEQSPEFKAYLQPFLAVSLGLPFIYLELTFLI